MDVKRNHKSFNKFFHFIIVFFIFLFLTYSFTLSEVQAASSSVELNGDSVEYSMDGEKVFAEGDVEIVYQGTVLLCDELEFHRKTKMAYAKGNVFIVTKEGELSGDDVDFDFNTMKGNLVDAKMQNAPFYGGAKKMFRVSDEKIILENGYITTSDYDKPGYRIKAKKIDVYPGDRVVGRNVIVKMGPFPLFYLPRYTQSLRDNQSKLTLTPGYDSDWGAFLLADYRQYVNENLKMNFNFDYRDRKDVASGVDVDYNIRNYGSGLIRTYYMNERTLSGDHVWGERDAPTTERERYRAQWRHKWDIDDKNNIVLQYHLLSDGTLLKDYFSREYDEESASPSSYFLYKHIFDKSVFSFRTDARINRFSSAVERLPELRFDLANQEILDSGFYLKNTTMYSNLVEKTAAPSEVRQKTDRTDVDTEISYPMKISFLEFNPFIGSEHTHYTRTKAGYDDNVFRGQFKTGASLSTKFYRLFDVEFDQFGVEVNRLRHLVTPSIAYSYKADPTVPSSWLDQYDSIDELTNANTMNFSLENKLQTKRNDQTVDLLRFVLETDYRFHPHPGREGFEYITADIDFKPTDWLTFYSDTKFDVDNDRFKDANFDLYINNRDKWSFDIGKRWDRDVDDQLTTEFKYKLNRRMSFRAYNRFDLDSGVHKEQEYSIIRDLHSWDMELTFNETRNEGNEIYVLFRLKAFPDIKVDMGNGFNKRKSGTQSE